MMQLKLRFILIFYFFAPIYSYKPVVLLHGILTGSDSMEIIGNRIKEMHPGTLIYNLDRFEGWSSLDNMWYQVKVVGEDLIKICNNHTEGIHFLGYSQGALLGRTVLQTYSEHNVKTYISLSGPQAGQYGTNFLHIIFPNLALKSAYELFYSRVGQHTSVGNYWNDPHHQFLYYEYSEFLPYVNNDISAKFNKELKNGIVKLNKMVLIGGPDDNVITPWESSQFGYYDSNGTVVTLKNRSIYLEDKIGLRELDEQNKLVVTSVPGVDHFMWHLNTSIVDDFILQYLD